MIGVTVLIEARSTGPADRASMGEIGF